MDFSAHHFKNNLNSLCMSANARALDPNTTTTEADTHSPEGLCEGQSEAVHTVAYLIVLCGANMSPAVDALVMHLSNQTTRSPSNRLSAHAVAPSIHLLCTTLV